MPEFNSETVPNKTNGIGNILDRVLHRNKRPPMATRINNNPLISRRNLLKAAGAVGAVTAIEAVPAIAQMLEKIGKPEPKKLLKQPLNIILKDINLRQGRHVTNPNYGDFNLKNIAKINGLEYNGEDILNIINATTLPSDDPDNKDNGQWVHLELQLKEDVFKTRDAYFVLNDKTVHVTGKIDPSMYEGIKTYTDNEVILNSGLRLSTKDTNVTSFKKLPTK